MNESADSEDTIEYKKELRFGMNTKYEEIQNSTSYNFENLQKFSISLWVKFYGFQLGTVLAKMNEDGSDSFKGWDLRFQLEEGKQIIVFNLIHKYPTDVLIHKTHEINEIGDYQWHHLFVQFNGLAEAGSIEFFVDSKRQEFYVTRSSLNGDISNDHPITIGGRLNDVNHFNGIIYDLRIKKDK